MRETPPQPAPGFRMLVDFGPLLVFFLVNTLMGGPKLVRVMAATAAFMIATFAAMGLSWWKTRHISPMLWITGLLVLVFGGLTLWFHDESFIKVKPTIVYTMFAAILFWGPITGRPLLQMLLENAYPGLSARGWRLLTVNWALFFVVAAALNELVWRTQSWNFWVAYKLWGMMPLTFLFALANIPMLMRHGLQVGNEAEAAEQGLPPEG